MSVQPKDLENQERDLSLRTRDGGGSRKRDEAETELRVLRERIAAAGKTTPRDTEPHCGDCFKRGWAAALRAIGDP